MCLHVAWVANISKAIRNKCFWFLNIYLGIANSKLLHLGSKSLDWLNMTTFNMFYSLSSLNSLLVLIFHFLFSIHLQIHIIIITAVLKMTLVTPSIIGTVWIKIHRLWPIINHALWKSADSLILPHN